MLNLIKQIKEISKTVITYADDIAIRIEKLD